MNTQTKLDQDRLISSKEASFLLGIDVETLRRWASQGRVPSIRLTPKSNRMYKLSEIKKIMNGETKTK